MPSVALMRNRTTRALRAVAVVLAFACGAVVSAPAALAQDPPPDGPEVTVMTRNLYLGADIGVALDLLPDLAAAAQFMWDQVAATDFDARAPLLEAEAAATRPDVIGLQEATLWRCRGSLFGDTVPVFDFTQTFLDAARAAGVPYVIAEADGQQADNPGYSIGPLPGLTVTDPETFGPIFGKDSADCGFRIGDVLLVREDLAGDVVAAGTSEYTIRTDIVPTVLSIDRGYAWADLAIDGATTRFVTTHLESLWDPDSVPASARQAEQLVADLAATTGPLVVMGDFNADPRDPRGPQAPNPGGQPEASSTCPAQPSGATVESADATCNAYWIMREAGYESVGPDPTDPANATWGASALLAGPDPERLRVALQEGNEAGYTDRLDYVFVRNGAQATSAALVGATWPAGDTWPCDDPEQIANTAAAGEVLRAAGLPPPPSGQGLCLPTDHVGVVATVAVPAGPPRAIRCRRTSRSAWSGGTCCWSPCCCWWSCSCSCAAGAAPAGPADQPRRRTRASSTRTRAAEVSTVAPNTSPVTPPNRSRAVRRHHHAGTTPASTASAAGSTGSPTATADAMPAATATATSSAAPHGATDPATHAPIRDAGAAGRAGTARTTAAARATMHEATSMAARTGQDGAAASAASCSAATPTSATTPNGPMSDRCMTATASGAGRREPSPSAQSASPSRCRPRVSHASAAHASAAPSRPGPAGRAASEASAPSTAPTAGPTARTTPGRRSGPTAAPAGIREKSPTAARASSSSLTREWARRRRARRPPPPRRSPSR